MQIGVETARAVANKRIFVVDNDEITRAILQFMLRDENETHDLSSLEAAFRKAAEWPPDLMLVGLPIVEGDSTALPRIAERMAGARVLLVADAGVVANAESHVGRGAHGVLAKPLTVESVRRRVDGALGLLKAPMIQLQVL